MPQCKFCDDDVLNEEYAQHVRTHKKQENLICLACGSILGKDSLYSHAIYLCSVDDGRISSRELLVRQAELSRLQRRNAKFVQGGLPTLGKNR
jgi:hypothetical protein